MKKRTGVPARPPRAERWTKEEVRGQRFYEDYTKRERVESFGGMFLESFETHRNVDWREREVVLRERTL